MILNYKILAVVDSEKFFLRRQIQYEPHLEKTCLMPHVNNKGADQPAHLRNLISTFVVCFLDSLIPLNFYIRNFKPLPSFCGCIGQFVSTLVANPQIKFSRDEAHVITWSQS